MHPAARTRARTLSRTSARALLLFFCATAAAALFGAGADAANRAAGGERHVLERHLNRALVDPASSTPASRSTLSDQEYFSFSGVGAIVCTVNGAQRNATAFLVGAFDIGVTVAHTFVDRGRWVQPEGCVYTTTDSLGQVRERIPVAYVKAQWQAEADALGQVAKDFAVIRLVEPSRFARRTMPLGKFSGFASNVLMVGFKSDIDMGTMKLKTSGRIYDPKSSTLFASTSAGYVHDMDARDISAGAPVIDERSGVIIGIHTQGRTKGGAARNTMITMNEWLETTLREELQIEAAARTH